MAAHNVQLSEDGLLAEYVPLEQFKGVLEQTVGVGPDLLAMVIRNGEVVSATHGGHIGIGGIWRTVKDAVIGQHALRLLIADLKPFQLICGLTAVSRDKVPVQGEITIEFQVNPDQPSGVLGLMRDHSSVLKDEMMVRFAPHLGDRVLEAVVGQVDAADLRGNTAVQDKVQAEIMREVERIAGDMSLMVRAVSLRWAYNDEEAAAIETRNIEREQEMADVQFAAMTRELNREHEATKLKLSTELDLEKVKAASEDELRQMMLSQELAFSDARDAGVRLQEMNILEHEYAKLRKEREEKFQGELANAQNDIEKAHLTSELRKIQRETEKFDTDHQLAIERLKEVQRLELEEAKREADRKHAQQLRDANIAAIDQLNTVENKDAREKEDIKNTSADSQHRRDMEKQEAEQKAKLEEARLIANQSPEVILAMKAGLAPGVAEVLVEQAKANSSNNDEVNALLRQQIEMAKEAKVESAEQAKHFFEIAMKGNVGVAQASGGTAPSAPSGGEAVGSNDLIACNNCGRMISIAARFCHYCGHQMRT